MRNEFFLKKNLICGIFIAKNTTTEQQVEAAQIRWQVIPRDQSVGQSGGQRSTLAGQRSDVADTDSPHHNTSRY